MKLKRAVFFLTLCVFFVCSCQTVPTETPTASKTITPVPEPYTKDEFPVWAKDLRRAEIITLGSLPFSVLVSTLGYTTFRYINSGFDSAYSPNPFASNSSGANLSTGEQIGIIAAAAGISIGVGLADFIIAHVKRKSAEKKKAVKEADGSMLTVEPLYKPSAEAEKTAPGETSDAAD